LQLPVTQTTKALAFSTFGFLCFSLTDVFSKFLTAENIPASEVSFSFSVISIVIFLALSGKLGGLRRTFQTQAPKIHFLRGLLQAPSQPLIFFALSSTSLANAYAIIFLAPFLTAALAWPILGEKGNRRIWFVIFTGFCGVLVAMRPDIQGFTLPIAALLIAALSIALRNSLIRRLPEGETHLSLVLYPCIAIAIGSLLPMIPNFMMPRGLSILWLLTGGVTFSVGLFCVSLAFRMAEAAKIAATQYSQLIWGVLFGILIFSDMPDLWTILGLAIIAISGFVLIETKSKNNSA